jgi:hypothetical protein
MKSFYKEIGCGEIGRMSTVAEGYFANFSNTVNKYICVRIYGKDWPSVLFLQNETTK